MNPTQPKGNPMTIIQKTKTRIAKFNDDHPQVIGAFSAGLAIAGYLGVRAVSNTKDGLTLINAVEARDELNDETYLYVTHKNGNHGRMAWNKPEIVQINE